MGSGFGFIETQFLPCFLLSPNCSTNIPLHIFEVRRLTHWATVHISRTVWATLLTLIPRFFLSYPSQVSNNYPDNSTTWHGIDLKQAITNFELHSSDKPKYDCFPKQGLELPLAFIKSYTVRKTEIHKESHGENTIQQMAKNCFCRIYYGNNSIQCYQPTLLGDMFTSSTKTNTIIHSTAHSLHSLVFFVNRNLSLWLILVSVCIPQGSEQNSIRTCCFAEPML